MRIRRPTSNLPAIACMRVAMLCLAASDAAAKRLVERFSPFQILFVRSLIALPLAVAGV